MINRKISILLIVTLILTSITGCSNNRTATATNETETKAMPNPYFSVTNAFSAHDVNHYMQLDVKIPKIVYTGEDNDDLIDPINDEMLNNVTDLVDNAKANAMKTYEDYLESAKDNIISEREKKIDTLKNKYKSILGSDEVKALSEVINTDITVATESYVYGFTDTDLIIPGLHNKKIIVVDTSKETTTTTETTAETTTTAETSTATGTSFSIKETSMSIEGRPGVKSEKSTVAPSEEVKETVAEETTATPNDDSVIAATLSSIEYSEYIIKADVIPETTDESLTLDNFYKELDEIKKMSVPSVADLTKNYIPTTIICDFDVKCLDSDYLSLFIELYQERLSSQTQRFFYNIDLKNKTIVHIKDILGDNYKEMCVNAINNDINTWSSDKKSLLKDNYNVDDCVNEKTAFFINNNHKPVIALDKYAISVGAAGYLEVEITEDKIGAQGTSTSKETENSKTSETKTTETTANGQADNQPDFNSAPPEGAPSGDMPPEGMPSDHSNWDHSQEGDHPHNGQRPQQSNN